jgi:hypothetical protein
MPNVRPFALFTPFVLFAASQALALDPPPSDAHALSPDDETAAFRAAGFLQEGGVWRACGDPGTEGYMPGEISSAADVNGDGLPEAVITETSSFCFGMTGMGYSLVSKQKDGSWKVLSGGPGIPTFLESKGADGWPDIEVGGPGFCFPVLRWNGTEYKVDRHQYQGKLCQG